MKQFKLFFACALMSLLSLGQVWAADVTGTINFGSASGSTAVNSTSVTGNDSQDNEWTITTVMAQTSFTQNASYSQIGASSKPATSITFTTTLAASQTITAFSAKFGGFSGTAGTVTLKVGDETVGTGSLNAANDVTVNKTGDDVAGTVLTVEVTGISKGVKAYYISYTYDGGGATLSSIAISGTPDKTTYEAGEEFDPTGLVATGTYSDASNADLTSSVDWSYTPAGALTEGLTSVNVTATKGTVSSAATPVAITVTAAPTKSTLDFTEKYSTGGATADDGAEWTVTSDGTESNFDNTSGIHYGTNSANVTYVQLATSDISGTISKVVVNARDAQATATITVTVGGVAFTCSGSSTATNTSTNYIFTGSGSGEIVVRIDRGSSMTKAIYCKSIVVSYEADASAPSVTIDPTAISLATPDAANGTIDATYTNVTLASVTVGRFNDAECTEAFTGDWLTATLNGDKDIEYTVAENTGAARTAYIKLTAPASNGTSPDVVKVIEVSQAKAIPTYTSLSDLFDAATGTNETVNITFNNWVISAITTNNAYLTDGTYGLIIYSAGHDFVVGHVLSGTAQTQLKLYRGNAQITGLTTSTPGLSVTTGGTITSRVVSDPTTLTGAHAGSVITISGSCTEPSTGTYLINGVQLYNTLYSYEAPTAGNQYNCTGVFVMYNTTKEILPRQASDLEEETTPTAVIALDNIVLEKGQNTTLAATITPAVASSAPVVYSILDGDSYVSLAGAVLTANEVGTAHIRATVEDDLPNYYGATKDITVTVNPVDSRYKAEQEGFDAISGVLTTVTEGAHKDKQYISYEAKQGASANVPAIYDTDKIRLYQNGGLLVIGAAKGCKIDQVFLTTGGTYNSTTIGYSTSEESIATTGDAVAKNTIWNTPTGLNTDSVVIVCLGTDKYSRIDVAKLDVRYTGDPVSVSSIAVSGTYPTEFEKNAAFDHTGAVVTATYSDDSHADVTTLAEFVEPDMSTLGVKTVTVNYGGKSTTYDIEIVAASVTSIALTGTYPTSFAQGDAFDHTGMVVTATYSDASEVDVTADATFSGYDMSGAGVQTVTVAYGGKEATYKIVVAPANTDIITVEGIGETGTGYQEWSAKTFHTSAIYAGDTYVQNTEAIQIRTSGGVEGIVVTAQNGTKVVKRVTVSFATAPTGTRKLQVYGKHSAYATAADLFSADADTQGELIGELAADGTVDCTATDYEFIGIRSYEGAMYLAYVMVEWGDATPSSKEVIRDGLSNGKWGTLCPKQTVENVEGATFYQISYLEEQAGLPYNMVWDAISGTTLTAGQPYFFIATGEEIRGNKTGAELDAAGAAVNGFCGYIGAASWELPYVADYDPAQDNTFVIYNNEVLRINAAGTMLRSERCYIKINATVPSRTPISPMPGRDRIRMSIAGVSVVTGMEEITNDQSQMTNKVIIDGRLYILRGEKMYDATGRMVK